MSSFDRESQFRVILLRITAKTFLFLSQLSLPSCHTKIMASLTVMIIIILFHCKTSFAKTNDQENYSCSSSCGNIHNITSPLRLTTDPLSCGNLRYNLSCENNRTVLYLRKYGSELMQRSYVEAINYNNYTIRLADPNIRKDDCSSIPANTFDAEDYYYNDGSPIFETRIIIYGQKSLKLTETVILINCESPVLNPSYVSAAPCTFDHGFFSGTTASQSFHSYYFVLEEVLAAWELESGCWIEQLTCIAKREKNNGTMRNLGDIRTALIYGFELSWIQSFGSRERSFCFIENEDSNTVRCVPNCYFPNLRKNVFDYESCGKGNLA